MIIQKSPPKNDIEVQDINSMSEGLLNENELYHSTLEDDIDIEIDDTPIQSNLFSAFDLDNDPDTLTWSRQL